MINKQGIRQKPDSLFVNWNISKKPFVINCFKKIEVAT